MKKWVCILTYEYVVQANTKEEAQIIALKDFKNDRVNIEVKELQ